MKILLKKIMTLDDYDNSTFGTTSYYIFLLIEVDGKYLCYLPRYAKEYIIKIEKRNKALISISSSDRYTLAKALNEREIFLKNNDISFFYSRHILRDELSHPLRSKIAELEENKQKEAKRIRDRYNIDRQTVSFASLANFCLGKDIESEYLGLLKSHIEIANKACDTEGFIFDLEGADTNSEVGYWYSREMM